MAPRLRAIAFSWGCKPDVCDDLVQETVATAIDKLGQLRSPDALESWIISIFTNCHNLYLRRARYLTDMENVELVDDDTPLTQLDSSRTVEMVRAAIAKLSDEHRKVLTLVDMEGMKYNEVAAALNIRIGTVMSRLCRARARLRIILKTILQKETSGQDQNKFLRRVK